MTIMAPAGKQVFGGVDTHQDLHAAAVIDKDGSVLATKQLTTTRHGYLTLIEPPWVRWRPIVFDSHGPHDRAIGSVPEYRVRFKRRR